MNVKSEFKDGWALITGASSGIGEAMALQLAKGGMNLILVARRKEKLEGLAEKLRQEYGVGIDVVAADLGRAEDCRRVYDEATKDGRKVQVAINNAGKGNYGPFLHHNLEDHLSTIELNITALTKLTYWFVEHMLDHGLAARIGNVSSIAAYQSVPQFGVYCGTKTYVRELSETLNHEFRASNLRVGHIAPGGTYTEFMDHSGQHLKNGDNTMGMMSSEAVARIGLDSLFAGSPAVVTGWLNKFITFAPRLLPGRLMLSISDKAMRGQVEAKPGKREKDQLEASKA